MTQISRCSSAAANRGTRRREEEIATLAPPSRLAGGGAAEEREASRRVDRVSCGGDANAARAEIGTRPCVVFPGARTAQRSFENRRRCVEHRAPPSLRLRLRVAVPFPGAARTWRGRGRKRRRTRSGCVVRGSAERARARQVPVPPGVARRSSVSSARGAEHTRSALDAEMENATALLEGYQAGTRGGRVVGGVDAIVVADAVGALGRRRVVSRMVSETGNRETQGKDFGVGDNDAAMMVV